MAPAPAVSFHRSQEQSVFQSHPVPGLTWETSPVATSPALRLLLNKTFPFSHSRMEDSCFSITLLASTASLMEVGPPTQMFLACYINRRDPFGQRSPVARGKAILYLTLLSMLPLLVQREQCPPSLKGENSLCFPDHMKDEP